MNVASNHCFAILVMRWSYVRLSSTHLFARLLVHSRVYLAKWKGLICWFASNTGDDNRPTSPNIYDCELIIVLTHWGRDKIAAIFQKTFSNVFSWMFKFRLRFHWRLFPRVQLTIFPHWFRWRLGAGLATRNYMNQWWLVDWRLYASLDLNKLI